MDDIISTDPEASTILSSRIKRPRLSVDSIHIMDDVKNETSSDDDVLMEYDEDTGNNDDSDSEEGMSYLYFTNTVARKSLKHKNNHDPDKSEAQASSISSPIDILQSPQEPPEILTYDCDPTSMRVKEFKKEQKLLVPPPGDPFQAFQLFFDDKLLDFIVEQTNKNAEIMANTPGVKKESRIWEKITRHELMTFIGLLLHTGLVRMNGITDYWRKHYLINLACFWKNMKLKRFLAILNNLNFSVTQNSEPLCHIRLIIDDFNEKMKNIYYPGKQLTVEESPVLWPGRIMYGEMKCDNYEFKLYILAEPDGIILKTYVNDIAKDETTSRSNQNNKSSSIDNRAEKIVLNLLDDKLDTGHSVYMDEYYNSYKLAFKLLARQTYCTGTLNANKAYSPENTTELAPGENKSIFAAGVHIGRWRGKREVLYISTEFRDEMVEVANKRDRIKMKPKSIVQYNEYKFRKQREMVEYYPLTRRTLPWYTKLFIHILQMSMVNAYHLYNMFSPGQKMDMRHFRVAVLEKLLPQDTSQQPFPHKLTKVKRARLRIGRKGKLFRQIVGKDCIV